MVVRSTKLEAFETIFQRAVEIEQRANRSMQPTPQSGGVDG
jgi:hypothetical protein